MSKFKPGDRVSVVHGARKFKGRLSVCVIGPEFWYVTDYCEINGPFHERQLRKLKPKPKPKPKTVTKTREVWVNVYDYDQFIYFEKKLADIGADSDRRACIPVTLTWEEPAK